MDSKLIEKQNKAFHKSSKKKQRIAIAKDVLAQLKAKKYVAKTGDYVRSNYLSELDRSNKLDLQKALLDKAPECTVCGLGAAFCSMARLGDRVQLNDVNKIHEVLEPIFGMHQVELIEHAFEGMCIDISNDYLSDKEESSCERFCNKRPEKAKRLAAIFRNIIKNDGVFKP